MELSLYQVDAFASRIFTGNPAAVVPLEVWLGDATMQAIALENNLSETAFFVRRADGDFDLRWFTPMIEVDLCGHATLAAAHVICTELEPDRQTIRFHTKSGALTANRKGSLLELDFPISSPERIETPEELNHALGAAPIEAFTGDLGYVLAIFDSESTVRALSPNFAAFSQVDGLGVITTAPGDTVDFVSRFFAPAAGVNEDPVTGSAHCMLTPYWVERLGRNPLNARQVSKRGGELRCELLENRVLISGQALTYMKGRFRI